MLAWIFFNLYFCFICMCVLPVYVCIAYACSTCGGQKRVLDALKLELQTTVGYHVDTGNRLGSDGKTARAFNCWASSPVLAWISYMSTKDLNSALHACTSALNPWAISLITHVIIIKINFTWVSKICMSESIRQDAYSSRTLCLHLFGHVCQWTCLQFSRIPGLFHKSGSPDILLTVTSPWPRNWICRNLLGWI